MPANNLSSDGLFCNFLRAPEQMNEGAIAKTCEDCSVSCQCQKSWALNLVSRQPALFFTKVKKLEFIFFFLITLIVHSNW